MTDLDRDLHPSYDISTMSSELIPHSFLELQYVTTNPDDAAEAILLNTSLDEWINNVALRSPTISRFASFNVVQGLVTVNSDDLAVRSERYGLSGITYIDGALCDPTESAVLNGLASVTLDKQLYETDNAFVAQRLAALRRQPLDCIVIGRFGDSLHAFDPGKDKIIQSRRR